MIVLADGDNPGEAAARNAAMRWKREARACASPVRRKDWTSMTAAGPRASIEGV